MNFNKINIQDLQLKHQLDINQASGGMTGSVQIPLPGGRNNVGPGLSLNYNSSSRNSAFGIGWSLAGLSFISIDTKKGLPKYDGTDAYAFNGGISLIPALVKDGAGWKQHIDETPGYWIYYYRPKAENAFIRFAKWVRKDNRTVHWRTTTGDNAVSVYGIRDGIVCNPKKRENIFIWLLEEQYDNQGNAALFEYKTENSDGIDFRRPSEHRRIKDGIENGFAQKYPDRVLYGNSVPVLPDQPVPPANKWLFEAVFDYGGFEHRPYETNTPSGTWTTRPDPFSVYNPGFEIRTYRLCRRILSYRNIPELSSKPSLSGIFQIDYNEDPLGSTIKKVSFTGVRRDLIDGTYSEKTLPPLSFSYTKPKPDTSFKPGVEASNINVPQGFNNSNTRFIDLFGEGLPGILTEAANNWYYKPNRGGGFFESQEIVISKPSQSMGVYVLGDFDQDGNPNLFSLQGRTAGYYEYDRHKETWSGFRSFQNIPQVSNAKFIDVNADGFADLVVEGADKLTCYPFEGKKGFGRPFELAKPASHGTQYAPTLGDNLSLDYFMADMTGDGLSDQVRIKNGRVEYFPNLGNGHFGEAVLMENAPMIDFENGFDAARIRLFDLDGSGTTDIIYIGRGEIRLWHNASGNSFIEGGRIAGLPYIDLLSSAVILDFLGNGTPCLVWSNSLNSASGAPIQYLELTGGVKPRLMTESDNGIGAVTKIIYGYSGVHYLKSLQNGAPWISKIPCHFTVADQKIIIDTITKSRITTTYKYYDGHYDGNERSFVCFGRTEQYDAESFENASLTLENDYTQPNCTKTWLHPGMFGWETEKARQYYNKDPRQPLPAPSFFESTEALRDEDFTTGYRALAGMIIRQEIFAVSPEGITEEHPFSVAHKTYAIRKIQPGAAGYDGSFYSFQTEVMEISYDRLSDDPKIAHHLSLDVDDYGNVAREASIAYARRNTIPGIHVLQEKDYITLGLHAFHNTDTPERYQTGILSESKDFEINHIRRGPDALVSREEAKNAFDSWVSNAIPFDAVPTASGNTIARLTGWNRTYFWNNAQDGTLPLGQTGKVVLAHHEETACFNDALINLAFKGKVTNTMLSGLDEGNYTLKDGYWWQRAASNHFNGLSGFYSLDKVEKQAGAFTSYSYDDYFLSIVEITDPLGSSSKGEIDYNLVEAYRLTDANDNVSEVLYDALGVPVATTYQGTVLHNGSVELYGNDGVGSYSRRNDESFDNVIANPGLYLQNASNYLFYDLVSFPLRSIRLTRENLLHDGKGNVDNAAVIQIELDYQDGFGRVIQNKRKVEPGPAIQRNTDGSVNTDAAGESVLTFTPDRWLASGHMVYNNKQLPVRQFEPFFSGTHLFENDTELEEYGTSIEQYYDAIGRMRRTDFPDSTFTETLFTPWEIKSFDRNDTVARSRYKELGELVHPPGTTERMALDKALAHKETPAITQFDPLGRGIVRIETNDNGTVRKIETLFDVNGNAAQITDARGLPAFEYIRDMQGRLLYEKSMDAGEKWSFHNNDDQTIHLWDGRNLHQRTHYDNLDRVLTVHVDGALGLDQVTERFVYGEDASITQAKEKNLRGALVIHYDQAGIQELKLATPGNLPLHTERRLTARFSSEPDWGNPAAVNLAPEVFVSKYIYDGLGRPVEQNLPDQTTRHYVFNQGGGLQKILVTTADGILNNVEVLKNSDYDARGMRQSVLLGNDAEISYTYDISTSRMKRLKSRKITGTQRIYQDIRYTYDPVGNLVHLADEAQQPTVANPRILEGLNVSSHSEFEYDALYQLISATGRVHQALLQNDYADRSREAGVPANWGKGSRHITLNNGAAVERYTRNYKYDEAGNIKTINHTGASQNWTKQVWTSATSNRSLPLLDLSGNNVLNPESRFDANGNCIYLPHLRSLEWNYRNNISKAVIIDRSAEGKPNDEEYYIYGGDGMRVRKITCRVVDVANDIIERTEKIYLDGCEIKSITRGNTEILRRFTSTIDDGNNTIARLHSWDKDTHARETGDITNKKIHYQLADHLGSASLELDGQGDVITYEEYFPYGGTAFIAGKNKRDIDLKEYRYSGKERDDFTGLYYFGYRYYAHWIGGWISPDPLGPEDSENLYLYVQNNPVNLVDPNGLQSTGELRPLGAVEPGLTAEQAMAQFNANQGLRLGIRVLELETSGKDWVIVRHRNLTEREIERFRQIQEQWAENPEIAEMFTELEISLGEAGLTDLSGAGESGDEAGKGGEGEAGGPGTNTDGGVNNGDGGNGSQTGDGVNPGDGHSGTPGTGGEGTNGSAEGGGLGSRGAGPGGGGTTAGGNPGTGTSPNSGNGAGSGNRGNQTGRTGPGGNGAQPGGQPGGSPGGVQGWQIGGSPGGMPGGQEGGDPRGSLEGDINGSPDGIPTGTLEGSNNGTEGGKGVQAAGGSETQPENQGQGGDPRTNWLDTATHWAGYLNLEFGGEEGTGEAGGIPGGLDLFGWRPPMWVRRTLQVAYIATTIVTTVIPIGKAALAAKVAIQGALKIGLRATARQLLTRAAAMIPSRAAIRGALATAKGKLGAGLSRIGGLFRKGNNVIDPIIDTNSLVRAFNAARKGSLDPRDLQALAALKNPGTQWVVNPTVFKEFAKVPHGGAARRRFLDSLTNLSVMTGTEAKTLRQSSRFTEVMTDLRAIANHSSKGMGDRAVSLGGGLRSHTHFNDIVSSAFAEAMKIPFVTGDRKFLNFLANHGKKVGVNASHISNF